jgi:hypothetical protein
MDSESLSNEIDPIDERGLIPRAKVLQLCGNISAMTLWRWEHRQGFNFPKSEEINGRFYYRLGEVLKWRPPAEKSPRPKRQPPSNKLKKPDATRQNA